MRLWSLHPEYLDAKGIVAAWREALLAQKVLQGKTRGYRNHPQLARFRAHPEPLAAIASFLAALQTEAVRRNYSFDASKIGPKRTSRRMTVQKGQLEYEYRWLCRKLRSRDPDALKKIRGLKKVNAHPLFKIRPGGIEKWEKV